MKITTIDEIENRKTIRKNDDTKSWFFESINKTDKPLARLTQRKERKERKEKGTIYQ